MNLSTIAILTLLASSSDSFAPGVPRRVAHTGASQLYADSPSPKTEKEVRNELTKRGTEINDEEKYKVLDGANMAAALTEDATPTPLSVQDQSSLEAAMERLVQPRSYPLFLAEKGIEIVEGALHKIFKSSGNAVNGSKDRVVILGTGWGAAAFLKDVDTNLYDVTVVSPRNFFLFTPMLAGASVGTVEFRSITEPIREVRCVIVIIYLWRIRFCPHPYGVLRLITKRTIFRRLQQILTPRRILSIVSRSCAKETHVISTILISSTID